MDSGAELSFSIHALNRRPAQTDSICEKGNSGTECKVQTQVESFFFLREMFQIYHHCRAERLHHGVNYSTSSASSKSERFSDSFNMTETSADTRSGLVSR